ncbi:glycosyltransferase family 4 protein [Arenivirga flava]|uniref:Colanic acid biosynthesis glycosyltransferase WcaL n=1 Tax=Arenivirga flava TaxID=1930060 RepID=A0AA37XB33_9MICO|nr:glycosyltransferase family 4 protein [Arenivirga flava]GMA27945.1 colanic acid biosynthesis glycosyltransferase WcaL [Arenivirga flava]
MPSETPRIGYVVKTYPRFSETFVVSELLAREARGERCTIFSLRASADERYHPELARVEAPVRHLPRPEKASSAWSALAEAAHGDPVVAAGIARELPELLQAPVTEAVHAVRVARLARDLGIEHLHAHFASTATTVARLAARVAGLPYSFTAHAKDIFHDEVDEADLGRKLADAHHVVTVSEYNLADLRRRFPSSAGRLHRVYNGLEIERFPYRDRPAHGGPLRVAAVGRLVEKKGFADLIEAVRMLGERGVPVEVRLAGGGELHDELAARIRSAGLDDRFALLGPRTQAEVRELLDWCDVFAAPSVVGIDGNADGLPTVLLEAMASGAPCLATDVTGIPEVILDGVTGRLLPQADPLALADALTAIADDPSAARAMTRSARALIERSFDSARQAEQLAELVAGGALAERAVA